MVTRQKANLGGFFPLKGGLSSPLSVYSSFSKLVMCEDQSGLLFLSLFRSLLNCLGVNKTLIRCCFFFKYLLTNPVEWHHYSNTV